MKTLKKWPRLLLLILSALLLSACGQNGDNHGNENNEESLQTKPEFKGAPNPSAKSDELLAKISPLFQRISDIDNSLGTIVAVATPDGVSAKGFGEFAAEKKLYNLNFQLASITKVFTGMALASMVMMAPSPWIRHWLKCCLYAKLPPVARQSWLLKRRPEKQQAKPREHPVHARSGIIKAPLGHLEKI